jgi:hypothetical protein
VAKPVEAALLLAVIQQLGEGGGVRCGPTSHPALSAPLGGEGLVG